MSKKSDLLIEQAIAKNDPELQGYIDALVVLGDSATANHIEYKMLMEKLSETKIKPKVSLRGVKVRGRMYFMQGHTKEFLTATECALYYMEG